MAELAGHADEHHIWKADHVRLAISLQVANEPLKFFLRGTLFSFDDVKREPPELLRLDLRAAVRPAILNNQGRSKTQSSMRGGVPKQAAERVEGKH